MRDIRSPLDGFRSPFGPQRGGLVQRLTALLSPGAAQLLIYPMADMAYLRQDRAGATPVTAAAQNVGRVLDAGPGGYHLTAVSDPARGVFGGAGVTFNGTNTAFQTAALPAPGVDKVQVFAAQRRLLDAGEIVLLELGPNTQITNGSFRLRAPPSAAGRYGFFSRGTALVAASSPTSWPAPDTSLLTFQANIGAPSAQLRIDGTQVAQSTADQGAGNFNASGTHQLNVGARNGSTSFFDGSTALLIVRFGPNLSTDTIAAVEALLAPYAEALT